ncbi:unnamed protein product, partial [Sphenostylis stenocarpa]
MEVQGFGVVDLTAIITATEANRFIPEDRPWSSKSASWLLENDMIEAYFWYASDGARRLGPNNASRGHIEFGHIV